MVAGLLFIIKATDSQDVYQGKPHQDLPGLAVYHVQCAVVSICLQECSVTLLAHVTPKTTVLQA
jgi:hypothetical protein